MIGGTEDREMALQVALEPETAAVAHSRRVDRDLDLLAALRGREPMAAERLVTTYGGRHAGPMPDWSARVDDPSIQADLRLALTSAIEELPAAYRSVLVLRDVQGLSNLEIAELLGLSVPVVKTRVHRARLFLRKQLDDTVTTLDMTDTHDCA